MALDRHFARAELDVRKEYPTDDDLETEAVYEKLTGEINALERPARRHTSSAVGTRSGVS